MKRLLVTLFLVEISLACAGQRHYFLDYKVPDQYKKNRLSVEMNFMGIPAVAGYTIVNGVYGYNIARCFSVGVGVGVLWITLDMYKYPPRTYTHAFLRMRLEAPAMRVSPFLFLDLGANMIMDKYEKYGVNPLTNCMIGARFRLRNGDKISAGIGIYTLWFGAGCVPFAPVPLVHFGYTF